jgi:hypothetical protein
MTRLRLHCIACRVFLREFCYHAAVNDNVIDFTWLPQGLHNTPDQLRNAVIGAVDEVESLTAGGLLKRPDAILLGYGLCSNGIAGVTAKSVPIVVPRADDCMALFFGSQERYLRLFNEYNGTYWLNSGWIEQSGVHRKEEKEARRQHYIELYGEENADYLLEHDKQWMTNYNYGGFITSDVYHSSAYAETARKAAAENGWEYIEVDGDSSYSKRLMAGNWDDAAFLVCPPGHTIQPSYDEMKLKAVPAE